MGVAASSIPPVPSIASVVDIGDQYITGVQQYVARDLGWSGSVGYTVINTYGDGQHAGNTSYPKGRDDLAHIGIYPVGFTSNSISVGTQNGSVVKQPFYQTNTNYDGKQVQSQTQFCNYFADEDPSTHGMGITAIQNVDNTLGVVYYLNINRTQNTSYYIGAGIGVVNNTKQGYPTCTRLTHHDWDGQTEPTYGSQAAFSGNDPDNGKAYIYALGNTNTTTGYWYITRVAQANAFNVNAYEYWNGNAWQSGRLINPGATQAVKSIAADGTLTPMNNANQGSIVYSPYYKAYVLYDVDIYGFYVTDLRVRTALRPEGPWGPLKVVATTGNVINSTAPDMKGNLTIANGVYAFSQQPWYDRSGKTTLATFTYGTSVQRLLNITFV